MPIDGKAGYRWQNAEPEPSHEYLIPTVLQELARVSGPGWRTFDLGCGNGSIAYELGQRGWHVMGVGTSPEGIPQANEHFPHLKLYKGSAYDDLAWLYGRFLLVIGPEVVEHLYFLRKLGATSFSLLELGGTAIVSTPYYDYWKNLVLALSGMMDAHFSTLWDHGHIKFGSIKTLPDLLQEAGFTDIRFNLVGRIPALAKSMIAIAKKP